MASRIDFKMAPSFDIESESHLYREWRSMWTGFECLSGISAISDTDKREETRLQAFYLSVSKETLRIVNHLPVIDRKSLDSVLSALEDHIVGTTNEVFERREFWKRTQREGESFASYILSLRELAARCNFARCCTSCEALQLRDRVTTGLRDASTIEKLLSVGSNLILEKLKDICEADESAVTSSASLNVLRKKTSSYKDDKKKKRETERAGECKFCGRTHELRKERCPAYGKSCTQCGGKNHFAAKCPAKDKSANLLGCLIASVSSPESLVEVTVQSGRVNVGNLRMLPDTGSDITAVPSSALARRPKLKRSFLRPKHAGRQRLDSAGYFDAVLTLGAVEVSTRVYVIDILETPLLSRKACRALKLIPEDFPKQHVASVSQVSTCSKDSLLQEYADVFTDRISVMKGDPFRIVLKDGAQPYCVNHVRRVAEPLKDKLKTELDSLESQGIIERVIEPTEWCAPITVQQKKSGSVRLCVDLKNLNKYVVRERWQSPTPLEVVTGLPQTAKFFTTVDAVKGYHQIPLAESTRHLTTFITPFGRYKYKRAPFGLSSICEHYNRRVSELISELQNTYHVVDDVIIADATLEQHQKNVSAFLTKCREQGVTLNKDKFHFAQPEVTFAGFKVNQTGYTVDDDLLRAIRDFPEPKSRTDLRSWFGLVNQLSSFSDQLAKLMEPLRPLLREANEFLWTDAHQSQFVLTKNALCTAPFMAYYSPKRKTALFTDASRIHGIGYVLKQQQEDGTWCVVRAGSRCLSSAESRYAMIELEMLAIVWAVIKCRLMLEGLPQFEIVTDHRPLIPILNKYTLDQIENRRLQRLREKLDPYSFSASWISTSENKTADALSRAPISEPTTADELGEDLFLNSLSASVDSTPIDLPTIQASARADENYQFLLDTVRCGFPDHRSQLPESVRPFWNVRNRLSIEDDIVMYGCRIVIPQKLRARILEDMLLSHQGISKMRERATVSFYWPRLTFDIEKVALSCRPCQQALPSQQKEPMLERMRATRAFEAVHADFFTFGGKQYLVYVDEYSGWPSLNCFGVHATARDLISALRSRFCEKSVPERLYTDGGPQFTATALASFLKSWGVQHVISSPHYPQSNGAAEASVKALKKIVRGCCVNNSVDMDKVSRGVLQYCNTPRYTGSSPAQLLFGHPIRDLLPAHRRAFDEKWQKTADELEKKASSKRDQVVEEYNTRSKSLAPLKVGDPVVLQDPSSKRWERYGAIVEIGNHRDYLIKLPSGRILRRNRRFLRKRGVVLPANGNAPSSQPAHTLAGPPSDSRARAHREGRTRFGRLSAKPHRLEMTPRSNSYV